MAKKEKNKEEIPPIGAGLIGGGLGALAGGILGYNKGYADGYDNGFRDGVKKGQQEGYKKGFEEALREHRERLEILVKSEILKKKKNNMYDINMRAKVPKHVRAIFAEACNDFIYNQLRSCCVMSGVAVEIALKTVYDREKGDNIDEKVDFNHLINWAHKKGLINKDDKFIAHAIRVVENIYKHNYKDVNKWDPLTMLMSSLRIINNIY